MKYCIYCMEPLENEANVCGACEKEQVYACPENHLRPGSTLAGGRYVLGAALGSGGFGITYIARDTRLGMPVAVKEFYPVGYVSRSGTHSAAIAATTQGQAFFERGRAKFLSEAKLLASLHDEPGIVDVRDFFEENNTAYIVMEYLKGKTLRDYLREKNHLQFRDAYALLRPVMLSMKAAHAQNVIHRDIAPDNIMLTRRGAKLLDFGAAREVFSEDERSLSIMVKRGYSPYEQYTRKDQGPWTDVYSLCAVLYRTVMGTPLPDAVERMEAPDAPIAFDSQRLNAQQQAALTKGLAVRPDRRFQSIDELMRALDAVPQPVLRPTPIPVPSPKPTPAPMPSPLPTPAPVPAEKKTPLWAKLAVGLFSVSPALILLIIAIMNH